MAKKSTLNKKPVALNLHFILLCLVLLMGHFKGMIILFALFCVLIIPKIKDIDNTSVLLLLFTFFYLLISHSKGAISGSSLIIYGLPWFFFYQYGKHLMNSANSEKEIVNLLIIIAFCVGLPVYLSVIMRIISTGSLVDVSRVFYFMNNQNNIVTGTGICVGIYMGYVGLPAFFILSGMKRERWFFLLLFVLSMLVAVNVVTRFPIIVSAFCFLLVVSLKYRGHTFQLIGVFILVVSVFFLLYYQGGEVAQVFEAYAERNEDAENVATLGSRTTIWSYALSNVFRYPLGWYGIGEKYSFMHNMWLDIARYSGIIPFILLCTITIRSFIINIRILNKNKSSLAYILLALNLCFCMVAFVEPVFGGLSVCLGCMVWGLQQAYLKRINNKSI